MRCIIRLKLVFKRLLVVGTVLENQAEIRERLIPRRCQFSNCIGLPKLKNMSCVSYAFVFRSKKGGRSFWSLLAFRPLAEEEKIKFRENLPNSQKFRGPTQSGRSQGSQR